jgi:hypothetical protein
MNRTVNLLPRLKAAGIHLGLSALVIGIVAVLVFAFWYPWPYSEIAGGRSLFFLVLGVDLVLGPLLTFVIFNTAKTRAHLGRDIAVIAVLQVAGLGYGLYTAYLARPVVMVFEVNQFRVVSDADVLHAELPQALPPFRSLSLTGPRVLGARRPADGDERLNAIDMALKGYDVGARPSYWRPYDEVIPAVLEKARPVSALYERYPQHTAELDRAVADTGRSRAGLTFLPVMGRESDWSVLLDADTAKLVGYVRLDAYF